MSESPGAAWFDCCDHCRCPQAQRTGHDDTCRLGCNDEPPLHEHSKIHFNGPDPFCPACNAAWHATATAQAKAEAAEPAKASDTQTVTQPKADGS